MKKLFTFTLLLLSVLSIQAQNRAEEIRKGLLNRDSSKVYVASHRGDWRNFPENSAAGINSAINLGADIIELDLQLTRDSVLILMHDPKLDRTTTGKGKISETDYADIQKLKLKNGCAIRTQHSVPTLEEILVMTKGRAMLNLDKADRYFDLVYALAKKTGTERQIIMKGKKPADEIRNEFGSYLNEIIYMPIVNLDQEEPFETIDRHLEVLKPCAFEILFAKDSNPLPMKLKSKLKGKSLIWYNTLWDTMAGGHDDDASLEDVKNGWGYLIDNLGARIIQTDRPQMVVEYLRSRKLHK